MATGGSAQWQATEEQHSLGRCLVQRRENGEGGMGEPVTYGWVGL
jgi:hypothetical protein